MAKSPEDYRDTEDLEYANEPPSPEVKLLLDDWQKNLDLARDGRDPKQETAVNTQLRAIQEALTHAKTAADALTFQSPEQCREFAFHAAAATLDAIHTYREPTADQPGYGMYHQCYMIALDALQARLETYDTAGRSALWTTKPPSRSSS